MRSPCGKDCPDRKEACAVSCPKWAEYVKAREAEYHRRLIKNDVGECLKAAYQRCGAKGWQA